MFKIESLNEEELLFIHEMIYGPILIKKDLEFYKDNIKRAFQKEDLISIIFEKMNTLEKDIFQLLMLTNGKFNKENISEKLSIILKQPYSIILNNINNLIRKNLIFTKDNTEFFVPILVNLKKEINIFITKDAQETVNNKNFEFITNIILYLLTKKIEFSKNKCLYKKDSENLKSIFPIDDNYLDIIGFFYNTFFYINNSINWNNVKYFFSKPTLERLNIFLDKTFPFLSTLFYNQTNNLIINFNDLEYLYRYNLINSFSECIKTDFSNIISFMSYLGLFELVDNNIVIKKYLTSNKVDILLKQSSNYNFFVNSDNNSEYFYYFSIYCDYVRFDKYTEFSINEKSIERAVSNNYTFSDFKNFITLLNISLKENVMNTIGDWFEKYSSYFYIEGNIFFVEDIKKGQIITKLAEAGLINVKYIKKNQIFYIENSEKENFFNVLEKSNINLLKIQPFEIIPDKQNHIKTDNKIIKFIST